MFGVWKVEKLDECLKKNAIEPSVAGNLGVKGRRLWMKRGKKEHNS